MLFPETETVKVYQPRHVVADDLNVLPASVQLVGSGVGCNIHRGVAQATDMASAVGVYAPLPSLAYFQPGSASILMDRGVLIDQNGEAWLIHGKPAVRTRFAGTAHVRCLLSFLPPAVWPEGISAAQPGNMRRKPPG